MDRMAPHTNWLIVAIALVVAGLIFGTPASAAGRCQLNTDTVGNFGVGKGLLPVGVRAPKGWAGDKPLPLVVVLHGSFGTGAGILRESGLGETADRHQFLIAYPNAGIRAASGFVWNIPGVPAVGGKLPAPSDRDDVAYIGTLVDSMIASGCVDPTRVYATGASGGGRMASWLGCVAADRFAAIAPVIGLRAGNPLASNTQLPDERTCRPKRAVSVIAFAGDKDTVNPIQGGGAPYWQYSMPVAEQRWAQLNHCTATPTARWLNPKVYEQRYANCKDGSEVVGRVTLGEGHRWVADNEEMWRLLSSHARQR